MTEASAEEQDRKDMAELAAGRDSALDELMGRHAEPVFHYLLRLLQHESDASDLAEEAFVKVYQNRDKYRPGSKFTSWLYAIATNLARDRMRYRSRHPQISLESPQPDTGLDYREALPDARPNPGESMQKAERVKAVQSAVADLPEDLRVPLILAEYENRSHAEIAAITGGSPKAVEMRLYRARQQLRQALGQLLDAI